MDDTEKYQWLKDNYPIGSMIYLGATIGIVIGHTIPEYHSDLYWVDETAGMWWWKRVTQRLVGGSINIPAVVFKVFSDTTVYSDFIKFDIAYMLDKQ